MKKVILKISLILFVVFGPITSALAQEANRGNDSPPQIIRDNNNQGGGPPPPPGGHGGQDDAIPAPVGGGLALLLALGAAYGAGKVYRVRRKF